MTVLFGALLAWAGPASGRLWSVEQGGTGDFLLIQSAIRAADSGDSIDVGPGVYAERVNFLGKNLAVRSTHGPLLTIIDAGETGSVVTMATTEGRSALLEGFTLRRGIGTPLNVPGDAAEAGEANPRRPDFGLEDLVGAFAREAAREAAGMDDPLERGRCGGGILLIGTSPVLRNLIVKENRAELGGGLYGSNASPLIEGCVFARNAAGAGAGAMQEIGGHGTWRACAFLNNQGASGGGLTVMFSEADLDNCRFSRNNAGRGGALYAHGPVTSVTVHRGVFWGNVAGEGSVVRVVEGSAGLVSCSIAYNGFEGEEAAILDYSDGATGHLETSILYENRSAHVLRCRDAEVSSRCNDHWPPGAPSPDCPPGIDEFQLDPLFCDPERGDLRLRADSPALPENAPFGCGLIGAMGAGCGYPAWDARSEP